MKEFTENGIAVVFGNSGGIGQCIFNQLKQRKDFSAVYGFSRSSNPSINLTDQKSFASIANDFSKKGLKIKLLINAIGFLHNEIYLPEKRYQDINTDHMKKSFEINTIPTALIVKYFTPLMCSNTKSILATLSARVGSISDNFLGGWYSYRISKAALNQLVKTASIEYKRKNPKLIIVSIHPGTVETKLSKPFLGKKKVQTPEEASMKIINVLNNLNYEDTGFLFDHNNKKIPF